MKALYAAALLALASCAHPQAQPKPESEPVGLDTAPADTTRDREFVRVNSDNPLENGPSIKPSILTKGDESKTAPTPQKRGFLGLFGRKATKETVQNSPYPSKKCKGCTFNIVAGDQHNIGKKATAATAEGAVANVTGKKSGPAVVASDSASLNALAGGGNLAAVNGDGNTTAQTKQDTTKEAPGPLAMLADNLTGPLGYVLAAAVVGGILFLLIRRRARKAAENLV